MHSITIKIRGFEPVILKISHETVLSLAHLLKKKISGIEYVLDTQSPKDPDVLKRRAMEYKAIYDKLIKIPKLEKVA